MCGNSSGERSSSPLFPKLEKAPGTEITKSAGGVAWLSNFNTSCILMHFLHARQRENKIEKQKKPSNGSPNKVLANSLCVKNQRQKRKSDEGGTDISKDSRHWFIS